MELDENKRYSLDGSYKKIYGIVKNYQENYVDKFPLGRMLFDKMVEVVNSKKPVRLKMEELARFFKANLMGIQEKMEKEQMML